MIANNKQKCLEIMYVINLKLQIIFSKHQKSGCKTDSSTV